MLWQAQVLSEELSKVCVCATYMLCVVASCRVVCVLQENPELDAIWRLLQYFWNKHYQGIWQALQGYQWSQQVSSSVQQRQGCGSARLGQQWAVRGTVHLCSTTGCASLTHLPSAAQLPGTRPFPVRVPQPEQPGIPLVKFRHVVYAPALPLFLSCPAGSPLHRCAGGQDPA